MSDQTEEPRPHPLPWVAVQTPGAQPYIDDANGLIVVQYDGWGGGRADASLVKGVVLAVNEHGNLVAELEALRADNRRLREALKGNVDYWNRQAELESALQDASHEDAPLAAGRLDRHTSGRGGWSDRRAINLRVLAQVSEEAQP